MVYWWCQKSILAFPRELQDSLGGAKRASRIPRGAPTEPRGIPNGALVVSEGHPGIPKEDPRVPWRCQKGIQASQGPILVSSDAVTPTFGNSVAITGASGINGAN